MASLIKDLYEQYQKDLPHADPNTRDWLLLNNNPVPVWILSVVYLVIAYGGPHYMKNRPAYSLQWFMVVYNLGLVALSGYMFIELYLSTKQANYSWTCAPYNAETRKRPEELRVVSVLWWYFFSKAIEFLDTVLMVLRKKNNQITFLHVFHHVTMINIWWWVEMFAPGGLDWFGAWLNCFVHVVMYSYYGLAAFPSIRGKLWWKRYITRLQMAQFVTVIVHGLYTMPSSCDFPQWGKNVIVGYPIILLFLFSNFYIHSYILPKGKKSKQDTENKHNGVTNGIDNHQLIKNGAVNGKKEI